MSLRAALLVVLSAFLHALWNALLKRERDTEGATVAVLAVAAAVAALAAIPGGAGAFRSPGRSESFGRWWPARVRGSIF